MMNATKREEATKRRVEKERLAMLLSTVEEMKPLVGQRIIGVAYEGEGEGTYSLILSNGNKVHFSSSGDDATYTSMFKESL
jgi:hypothetical protein